MLRRIRSRMLIWVVCALLLATGCGGSPPPPSANAPTASTTLRVSPSSPAQESSATPRSSAQPKLSDAKGALITAVCRGKNVTLLAVDADVGDIVARVDLVVPETASLTYQCTDGAYLFRQNFDRTYSRAAVTIRDSAQNSSHVGFIDVATQQLTDLDRRSDSFDSAPQNHTPVFNLETDELWYFAGDKIFRRDTAGGEPKDTTQRIRYYGEDSFTVAANRIVPSGLGLPDATGKYLARYSPTANSYQNVVNIATDPWAKQVKAAAKSYRGLGSPLAWIGDHQLIAHVDESTMSNVRKNNFALMTLDTKLTKFVRIHVLLPDTDRHNYPPVVSPDHRTIAFLSQQGNEVSLYAMNVAGSGTPKKLDTEALRDIGLIVEWL